MIKHVLLNRKKLPVPVPLRTLGELMGWIESAMISKEHSVTRVTVDNQEIDLASPSPAWRNLPLGPQSHVAVQADTPLDISIQTVDALKNLQAAVEKALKPLAVACWQAPPKGKPEALDAILEDVGLMLDLLDHVYVLIEDKITASGNIVNCARAIAGHRDALAAARAQSDWKAVARLLLNRLEPSLVDLGTELCGLEKCIFEYQADRALGRFGS